MLGKNSGSGKSDSLTSEDMTKYVIYKKLSMNKDLNLNGILHVHYKLTEIEVTKYPTTVIATKPI